MCEITITDGKATFAVPGAIFSMVGKTKGTCKATVPFLQFMLIVKDIQPEETEITFTEGRAKINRVTINAKTTFFENDRILRTIQLPINFTDADLLALSLEGYTMEELDFNHLTKLINEAEVKLKEKIKQAHLLLEPYGVTYDALEKIEKSIYIESWECLLE